MTGKPPSSWQPPKAKRSRGWRHSLKLSEGHKKAREKSRQPGAPDRNVRRPTPSMPPLPWKD